MGVSLFCPAKINLYLAITGRRPDGFHDLVSVAAPLAFGDELTAKRCEQSAVGGEQFSLVCDDPAVPVDGSNLILKAARVFAAATGWHGRVNFVLRKRTPMGAGLGGGSSDAVGALRALQQLAGQPLTQERLAELAATLGSDCGLFFHQAPVIMRGRGERVERLPESAAARLRGLRLVVFKPSFGISTPWAYGRMVARGSDYLPAAEAEARLTAWLGGQVSLEEGFFNNMEPAAFEKHLALPAMRIVLQREFGLRMHMSGSGSACFVVLPEGQVSEPVLARLRRDWGPDIFAEVVMLS